MRETIRKRKNIETQDIPKTGRPTIEEQTILTPEMEEFCVNIRLGYSLDEIADLMKCSIEKCEKFSKNATVQARIKNLQGDVKYRKKLLQEILLEETYKAAIEDVKSKTSKPTSAHLKSLIELLDPDIRKELPKSAKQSDNLQDEIPTSEKTKIERSSIFKKMKIEDEENKVEDSECEEQ